jgi:hypothetical protein
MENKKKSSVKDRLNAKQAKKIGKQQREYIPYDWALILELGHAPIIPRLILCVIGLRKQARHCS